MAAQPARISRDVPAAEARERGGVSAPGAAERAEEQLRARCARAGEPQANAWRKVNPWTLTNGPWEVEKLDWMAPRPASYALWLRSNSSARVPVLGPFDSAQQAQRAATLLATGATLAETLRECR